MSVGAGAVVTVNYTVTADAVFPPGTTSVANTATSVGGRCSSCGPIVAQTPRTSTVKALGRINGLAASATSLVRPGDVLTYNLTSTNASNAADSITLNDVVPVNTTKSGAEGLWSCVDGAVAGATCSRSVSVPANATVVTTYTVRVVAQLPTGTTQVAEYRMLDVQLDGTKKGALVSLDKDLGKNLRFGVGYNFTDFSSDLTQLQYKSAGWFVNLVGRF